MTQGLTVQRALCCPDFLGGADLALRELVAEFEEGFAGIGIVLDFAQGGEAFDGGFQGRHELMIVDGGLMICQKDQPVPHYARVRSLRSGLTGSCVPWCCMRDPSLRLKNGSVQDDALLVPPEACRISARSFISKIRNQNSTIQLITYTHLHSLRIRTPVMAWAVSRASGSVA